MIELNTFNIAQNAQMIKARRYNDECVKCGHKLVVARDIISNLQLRPASLECWNKECKARFQTVKEVQ